ncbi:hypothetical protein PAEPH01_2625 [Pancytospora epiphaga]|nr:hypothetical protein PAEPH01_2625 [Pancytospora epiphaga]
MRELNLVLDLKRDFMKGISILEDRVKVYESKLHSSERHQVFRADNRCFELYRRRFYRRLAEEQPLKPNVPEENIVAFWSTMWNQREVDTERYDEYLFTCVPDTSDQSVFSSAAEFIDIIKYLPN